MGGGCVVHCSRERNVAQRYERSLMVRWVVGSILHGVGSEM